MRKRAAKVSRVASAAMERAPFDAPRELRQINAC